MAAATPSLLFRMNRIGQLLSFSRSCSYIFGQKLTFPLKERCLLPHNLSLMDVLFNLHYSPVQWYQLYVLSALSFVIQQVRFAFVLSGLGILNGYKQMLPSWNELLPVILPVSNIWKEIFSIQRKFSALGGHTDICLLQLHTIRFHWILLLQEWIVPHTQLG